MAALAARKFSLFPQATSRTLLSRTLFQSQSTFHRDSIFSTPTTPSSRSTSTTVLQSHHLVETPLSEAQPGRKRAPTPEELRRRLPHTFRRIITVPLFFFFFFFKLPFPFFAIRLLRYLSVGRFSNSCSLFLCLSVMRRGSGALSPATHAHSTSHSQTYTTTFIHPWAPFPTELEPVLTSRWWPKEC
jgi:hypothetical protein